MGFFSKFKRSMADKFSDLLAGFFGTRIFYPRPDPEPEAKPEPEE